MSWNIQGLPSDLLTNEAANGQYELIREQR